MPVVTSGEPGFGVRLTHVKVDDLHCGLPTGIPGLHSCGGGGVTTIAFLQFTSTTVPPPGSVTVTDTVTVADFVNVCLTTVFGFVVVTSADPSPKL